MAHLDSLVRQNQDRLIAFAKDCGLNADQLETLIRLVMALTNARAVVESTKKAPKTEARSLYPGRDI